ncbi:MAG: hypothetical protein JO261_13895 [Alphaproteobacteria bacterium]|nr:hypothetical protein [Alphaproteobacteria bacterium]MBV9694785.1 hypothetical protein [Alphaproteobacteria bacterium]
MKATDPIDATIVRIREGGTIRELDYNGAMTAHMGSLWWGTAVGYRAMQAAAKALSTEELWSRDDLYVVGAHPGPGVRDAIDYVTDTVRRDRYKVLLADKCGMKCNSTMKFEWWVSDGRRTATIRLRDGFVPRDFYALSDRLGTDAESEEDRILFEISKVNLSARIWSLPLDRSFTVTMSAVALEPGELPAEMQRADYWKELDVGVAAS